MKPDTSQDTSWTWLPGAQGPKHEVGKLQVPGQKMLKLVRQAALSKPWWRRHQGPTCIREQVNIWPRSIEERDGAEPGRNGPSPDLFRARFSPRFALGAHLFIASASAGHHIHPFIKEPPTRGEAPGGSRRPPQVLEFPRRGLRLDPSCHGWHCVVKPWWSSGAVPWIHQDTCTFDSDINLILSLLLIYFDACILSFMCVASMWP
jgi:hypothetical protein